MKTLFNIGDRVIIVKKQTDSFGYKMEVYIDIVDQIMIDNQNKVFYEFLYSSIKSKEDNLFRYDAKDKDEIIASAWEQIKDAFEND